MIEFKIRGLKPATKRSCKNGNMSDSKLLSASILMSQRALALLIATVCSAK